MKTWKSFETTKSGDESLPGTRAAIHGTSERNKETYYAMARRYHPDRFHIKSGTKVHAEISSAFARVTQAYET